MTRLTLEFFDGDNADSDPVLMAEVTSEGATIVAGDKSIPLDAEQSVDLARSILAMVPEGAVAND